MEDQPDDSLTLDLDDPAILSDPEIRELCRKCREIWKALHEGEELSDREILKKVAEIYPLLNFEETP